MTDRIKDLAKQAGLEYVMQPCNPWIQEDLANFAELIVRECAGIIESQDVDPGFKHRMSWAVKKHFGVKNES